MIALLALAGCATDGAGSAEGGQASARAVLRDAGGATRGTAEVREQSGALALTLAVEGLAPGVYAAHMHTTGRCDAPDFMSAGGHWNPQGRQHGKDNPAGAHMGDLPNIAVGQDGRGQMEAVIGGARLTGGIAAVLDADGAAVIVHQRPDDYRTDPTGNAGGRQLCGVLEPAR